MLSWFEGKRILVTGAGGYIASNLISSLAETSCTIIRLSRRSELPVLGGAPEVLDVTGDVRDEGVWERVLQHADIVYHLAAQTSLYEADRNPVDDLKANVLPMLHLLETCHDRAWHPTVIFAGTVTETGIAARLPVSEDHRDCPSSVYDMHKLMAENYLLYYARRGIVQGTCLRLANVYGPGQKASSADRGILNKMIRKAMADEVLSIYGTGEYVRDYIYIDDVVKALVLAARHIDCVNGAYFVIGSGTGHSIKQAVELVGERVGLKRGEQVAVQHVDPPSRLHPVEYRNFVADPRRFMQATGFKIEHSLVDGIDRTIASFVAS